MLILVAIMILYPCMVLENDRYTYRVTWSEEDAEYVGLCAEFPSLSWLAETPKEALQGIRRVVSEVVADGVESTIQNAESQRRRDN